MRKLNKETPHHPSPLKKKKVMSASTNDDPIKLVEGHQYDGFRLSVEVRKPERRGWNKLADYGVEFEYSKVHADPKEAAKEARKFYDQYISQFAYFVYDDMYGDEDKHDWERLRQIQAQHRALMEDYDTNARKYYSNPKEKKVALTLKFERDQKSVDEVNIVRAFVELTIVRAVAVLTLEEVAY